MTPTTLAELFDTPKSEIDSDGSIYALNSVLKTPPWWPPLVWVWVLDERPDFEDEQCWNAAKEMLDELHAEHERRKDDE